MAENWDWVDEMKHKFCVCINYTILSQIWQCICMCADCEMQRWMSFERDRIVGRAVISETGNRWTNHYVSIISECQSRCCKLGFVLPSAAARSLQWRLQPDAVERDPHCHRGEWQESNSCSSSCVQLRNCAYSSHNTVGLVINWFCLDGWSWNGGKGDQSQIRD